MRTKNRITFKTPEGFDAYFKRSGSPSF